MNNTTYLTVLKNTNYRRLLMANFINRLGDSIDTIAFLWIVYSVTGEGTWSAIVFAINKIPSIIFLPLTGAFVEKRNKKQIMLICDLIRCLLVAAFTVAIATQTLSVAFILIFTFLISTAEAFRIPASTSFITRILTKETLDYGVILNVIVSTIVQIGGMALGGVLLGYFNAQVVFTADVISFIISILLILSIRYKETITAHLQQTSSLSIFKEGLKYIRDNKALRLIILLTILSGAAVCPLDSLQMPMVAEVFNREADYLSVLSVCVSIGTLLGGASYPRIKKVMDQKLLFSAAFFYIGLVYAMIAFFGFTTTKIAYEHELFAAIYFIYGIAASFFTAGLGLMILEHTKQEYISRTNAIYSALGEAVVPLVSALTGVLVMFLEIHVLFAGISVLIFLVLAVIYSGISQTSAL